MPHRLPRRKTPGGDKLSLVDAVGMAVGGMVGGGIFAVLGEAVHYSGNAAFIGFGLAGLLALLTANTYARLTTRFDAPGGSYVFIGKLAGNSVGGTVSWFVILGYVFTLSLYSHTFGVYAAQLFGLGGNAAGWLGAGVVILLAAINLGGVRASGSTEDAFVYTKLAIIMIAGGAGLSVLTRAEALPVFEHPPLGMIATAGLIFVAYEGFELLAYDYDAMADRKRNLGRALYISVGLVTALYMFIAFVTTGALADDAITAHSETVLGYVAQPRLGVAGLMMVQIAALLSTASAVNATIFAQARLARDIARDNQVPAILFRWTVGGVSVPFVIAVAALVSLVQYVATLNQITVFASLVFLLVFAAVNFAGFVERSYSGAGRTLPLLGCLGCLGAAGVLIRNTAAKDPLDLFVIGGIAVGLVLVRLVYLVVVPAAQLGPNPETQESET